MYTYQCFGSVSILHADGELSLRSRKHMGLLLYLCAHPRSRHSRADIATLLWDGGGARERHSLSQALYDIRSHVGPVIEATTVSLRLRPDLIRYEAVEFESAVEHRDHATALSIYRGEFAPTLSNLGAEAFDRWLEGERDRYQALAGIALRNQLAASEGKADWDSVCFAALRLIRMNGYDERAHRALMRGLWLKGDGASALAHYEELDRRMSGELPDGLGTDTVHLAEQIRLDERADTVRADTDPELIGRSAEFAVLRGAYDEVRMGRAASVVVIGERGIGKTRLLEEFGRYVAGRGARVVRSVSTRAGRQRPLSTAIDLMAALGLKFASVDIDAERAELELGSIDGVGLTEGIAPAEGIASGVEVEPHAAIQLATKRALEVGLRKAAADRPTVVIVDDTEYMDAASAGLLGNAYTRLADLPLLVIVAFDGACRADRAGRSLSQSLRCARRGRLVQIRPMDRECLTQIVKSAAPNADDDIVGRVVTLAGGNPLYGIELVRSFISLEPHGSDQSRGRVVGSPNYLGSIGAQGLREVLWERIQALSQLERTTLQHVAILGDAVGEDLLAEMLHTSDPREVLLTLEGKGLVEQAKDRWRLTHGVIRDYLSSVLGHTKRAAIHLAAATVLSRGEKSDPLVLAEHYANGGERRAAYRYAMQAASPAVASAPMFAAAAANLAATQAVSVRDRTKARLLEGLAELELGHYARAEAILLSLSGQLDEPSRVVPDVFAALAEAKLGLCDPQAADRALKRATRESPSGCDSPLLRPVDLRIATLDLRLAHARGDSQRMQGAAQCLDDLLKGYSVDSGAAQQAWLQGWVELIKYSLWSRSIQTASDVLMRHSPAFNELSPQLRVKVASVRAILAMRKGRLEEGEAIYEDLVARLEETAAPILRASLLNNLAVARLEQGRFERAAIMLDRCIAIDRAMGAEVPQAVFAQMNRGACALYAGAANQAQGHYEEAARLCESSGLRGLQDEIGACLGLVSLAHGSLTTATAILTTLDTQPAYQRWEEERFKAAWLRGFLMARTRPQEAAEYLLEEAETESSFDVPSYHKLRFLATLALAAGTDYKNVEVTPASQEARRDLVRLGCGWFARSATRWWQEARLRN